MARTKTSEISGTDALTEGVAVEVQEESTATKATKAKTAAAATEPTFALEVLKKHCRAVFGVPTVVFAGATAGMADGQYTKSEIAKVIEEWRKKEVK